MSKSKKKWDSTIKIFTWLLITLFGIIIGAIFSSNISKIYPFYFIDGIPPYVSGVQPLDNTQIENLSNITVILSDVGGSGMDNKKSELMLVGSKGGKIKGNVMRSGKSTFIFYPEQILQPDTYSIEIHAVDRGGNVKNERKTFTITEPPTLNITIKQIDNPIYKMGKYYAKYLVINNGDLPLSGITIDYSFKCFMNETKRIFPEITFLNSGDITQFDIDITDEINYNCTPFETRIPFYYDEKGKIRSLCLNETKEVCVSCRVNISLTTEELEDIRYFEFYYPFFRGNLSMEIWYQDCLLPQEVRDKNLTFYSDIGMGIFTFKEECLKGLIDMEWCKENKRLY